MGSSERSGPVRGGLYGGVPAAGPPGMAPRLLEFADELRSEGVAVGTSELLDAFEALDAVSWTSREDFREALAATLAKSQEDRHVLDVLFERFFFRAVEREAVERGEGVEQRARADLHPLGAQLLAELDDATGEPLARHRADSGASRPRARRPGRGRCGASR